MRDVPPKGYLRTTYKSIRVGQLSCRPFSLVATNSPLADPLVAALGTALMRPSSKLFFITSGPSSPLVPLITKWRMPIRPCLTVLC